ncbi:hypothetical protein [Bifidobacterium vansinderenii]|uniref:Uncharacterized protein n=1 Tax=Bifidobacterium vansinderenii TaxID=1984871 RepID=A0A229W078_9BIFI|nr:hypothetical protein [Bifidobacterium vansinderenii]OXN01258.1 hypothetical protein Tam10B_0258 [Bifidobacterium vansinderenii]
MTTIQSISPAHTTSISPINLSALSERLRASTRTIEVTDMGNGLIVTDERTPYLRTYIRPDGIVLPRWEYPAPDRRGRIRGLKPFDVQAVRQLASPIIPLTPFTLTGDTGQQTLLMRLHLDRQANRLAPHQVHTMLRLDQLTVSANARHDVWGAFQHLLADAIDAGGTDRLFADDPNRDMQILIDAMASPAAPSLIAALIIGEVERLIPDKDRTARDRELRFIIDDISYERDHDTQADQAERLTGIAVELLSHTRIRPDQTRVRMMRALLTGIANRLPASALAASDVSRASLGGTLILISWWLGRDLDRLAEAALRLELATGATTGTRAVRNGRPGWLS